MSKMKLLSALQLGWVGNTKVNILALSRWLKLRTRS